MRSQTSDTTSSGSATPQTTCLATTQVTPLTTWKGVADLGNNHISNLTRNPINIPNPFHNPTNNPNLEATLVDKQQHLLEPHGNLWGNLINQSNPGGNPCQNSNLAGNPRNNLITTHNLRDNLCSRQ